MGGLLLLAAVPSLFAQQPGMDLDRAIRLALEQNRRLAVDALGTRSAGYAVRRAESAFDVVIRPALDISSLDGDDATSAGLEVSRRLRVGTELRAAVRSEEFDRPIGRRARLALEVNQPLFRDYGTLVNEEPIRQATSSLRRTERQYHAQRSDLVLDVISSYESIQRLRRQVEADLRALGRARELADSTRAKESLGRTSRIDSLRVDLQQGQAESRLEGDRAALESEYRAFAELLGVEPGERFELAPPEVFEIDLPLAVDAVRLALDNRLDYAQALHDRNDASRGVRIARNLLRPDVTFTGRFEAADKPFIIGDGDKTRWFFGLTGDTNLNNTSDRLGAEQAAVEEMAAGQRIRVVELAVAREVQQRMLDYRRARSELGILERNLENAAARLELARSLFEVGRSDNFSVTDAETAFQDAEAELLSGQASASVAGYSFLHTTGTLVDFPAYLKPAEQRR